MANNSIRSGKTKVIHAGVLLADPDIQPKSEQSILIEGERIKAVSGGFIDPPPGGELIDLRKKFVLPGLIDCHVHLTAQLDQGYRLRTVEDSDPKVAFNAAHNAAITLAAGFTTVRDDEVAPIIQPAQLLQTVVVDPARDVVERVTQKMHVAALIGRLRQNFAQRCPHAGMIIGHDELDAMKTARLQPQQEIPPARSALAVGEFDRQHLA